MGIIEIVTLIVAIVCFFEWDELRRNNIRNDEKKFFIMGVLLLITFFVLLYVGHDINTQQLEK